MAEVWGPWRDHAGDGCPVPVGTVVHRVFDAPFDTFEGKDVAPSCEHIGPVTAREAPNWGPLRYQDGDTVGALVIRYRIRQFQALTDLKTICENPQPVREDA